MELQKKIIENHSVLLIALKLYLSYIFLLQNMQGMYKLVVTLGEHGCVRNKGLYASALVCLHDELLCIFV